jgi:hypothetical protein
LVSLFLAFVYALCLKERIGRHIESENEEEY